MMRFQDLSEELALGSKPQEISSSKKEMRTARVLKGISLPKGPNPDKKIKTTILESRNIEISFMKPGKEAALDWTRCPYKNGSRGNNPNDMLPIIEIDGVQPVLNLGDGESQNISFEDVFEIIDRLKRGNEEVLDVLGTLFCRMSLLADHEYEPAFGGDVVYKIPEKSLQFLEENTNPEEELAGLPPYALLHLLDALAWQEDVKYHTLGHNIHSGTGARNNLLTYAHAIAVFLNRRSFSKFAGSFARPPAGISALPYTQMVDFFPLLKNEPTF